MSVDFSSVFALVYSDIKLIYTAEVSSCHYLNIAKQSHFRLEIALCQTILECMKEAKDYRAKILEYLVADNPYVIEGVHTVVSDILYDEGTRNQAAYTGMTEAEIADIIRKLELTETEEMDDAEISDVVGVILEAFTRRLASRILWNAIYGENPSEVSKLARDEYFQNTVIEVIDS